MATSGAQAALGPAYIQICLPPPDVPAGTPGRATFGAKVYSAELAINGVFSTATSGAWIGFWTPYNAGLGTVNAAGTIATPAAIAPGAVTLAAKRSGRGATLAGSVTQGGAPRAGATVTIFGRREGHRPEASREGEGRSDRQVCVQSEVGDVLPRDRRRGRRREPGRVLAAFGRTGADPVPQRNDERLHGAEQGRQEAVAAQAGGAVPAPPALRFGRARHDSPRHLQLRRRGSPEVLVSARCLDGEGAARLLRRALRHGRGRLALLPPPRSGRHGALGTAHPARVHVPREGARLDDVARRRADGPGVRRLPGLARAPRALGQAPRCSPPVPPALHEVAGGASGAGAGPRAARTARSARRVPPPFVDGAWRARGHARVPRTERPRLRLRRRTR